MKQAIKAIGRDPWCITPSALETIIEIANREVDLEAVEARMGHKLNNTRTVSTRGDVAVIPVTGAIVRYANLFQSISGGTSLQTLAEDFATASEDNSISTILLNIDSPGGQASGIAEFSEMIRASDKKVIAYVGNQSASAGYWIASACDEIVAHPTAMVGSIGVVYALTDTSKADEKAGVTRIDVVSHVSPNKRPDISSKEGQSQIQAWADKLGDLFVGAVANFRGVSTETVLEKFGQGDMLIAEDALKAGMIDRLGDFESLLSEIQNNSVIAKTSIGEANMTLETFKTEHPELLTQISADAMEKGAESERNRIKTIDSINASGSEDIVTAMKFDGKSTANDVKSALFDAQEKTKAELSTKVEADASEVTALVGELNTETPAVEAVVDEGKEAMALALEKLNLKRGK